MLSIAKTLDYQTASATAKVAFSRRPGAYLVSAMLAGAYIGVAVVLMFTAAGPFYAQGAASTALIAGLVFSIALALVTVAGGELATSNMMTLTQGLLTKGISAAQAAKTLAFCFVANLFGALIFGTFVHLSAVMAKDTSAYTYLVYKLEDKLTAGGVSLFFKAILCNALVCLAIWSGIRLKSEGAKLFMIFLCLLAFITSGFEHVIANMTTFVLGLWLQVPGVGVADFLHNLGVVGLGNLIGGVIIGAAYVYIAKREVAAPKAQITEADLVELTQ